MATYVALYKYTEQGINNIKDAPRRVEAAKKAAADALALGRAAQRSFVRPAA